MAAGKQFDLVCVGNAIVDVQARIPEDRFTALGINRGDMTLVDPARAAQIYGQMPQTQQTSGGSGANSVVVAASLGGRSGFTGRVGTDEFGAIFQHDLKAQGVTFNPQVRDAQLPTGSSLILITGEGDRTERTMCTSLGCNTNFSPRDLDREMIAGASILLLEGYLFDQPESKAAFRQALELARNSATRVALTLSAEFCVHAHRLDFLELIRSGVDVLFANEKEITALYHAQDYDSAVRQVDPGLPVAVITHGSKGAMIRMNGHWTHAPAEKVAQVVDPTGAGDAYAGGFLHAYGQGKDAAEAGRVAALCASEVISHLGARPQVKLADYVAQRLRAGRPSAACM